MGVGLVVGAVMVGLLTFVGKEGVKKLFWGFSGLTFGMLAGGMLQLAAEPLFPAGSILLLIMKTGSLLIFGYLGAILGLKIEQDRSIFSGQKDGSRSETLKILDTSVIIDGRIADLCETGFIEGAFVIPQFILQELQHIADSSDSMKRARGRRGLDVLQRLQKMPDLEVRIVDNDFPSIREVDSKLVALGKEISGKVVTNDMNLNKVSELQGVRVLNINQLCNALKPVVLPGEAMRVFVLKEGKELGQGIAYLDDGTMIVIDEARKFIGKTVEISVTSVLQTPAGRMIFSRVREAANPAPVPVVRSN